jgi:hypothetical protein
MPMIMSSWAAIPDLIVGRTHGMTRPFIAALDGRSGAGKSTLARRLADHLSAAVIEGDDFYAGGIALRSDSAASRAAACIDWTRQRAVLEAVAAGRDARWRITVTLHLNDVTRRSFDAPLPRRHLGGILSNLGSAGSR